MVSEFECLTRAVAPSGDTDTGPEHSGNVCSGNPVRGSQMVTERDPVMTRPFDNHPTDEKPSDDCRVTFSSPLFVSHTLTTPSVDTDAMRMLSKETETILTPSSDEMLITRRQGLHFSSIATTLTEPVYSCQYNLRKSVSFGSSRSTEKYICAAHSLRGVKNSSTARDASDSKTSTSFDCPCTCWQGTRELAPMTWTISIANLPNSNFSLSQ